MGHGDGANVHILGMWFNFLFSAGLITYFVVRMAVILRQQEAQAVVQREDRLRNDQIMAVASLAAGTAHELGTPLSTMMVLVDEMLQDDTLGIQARQDCELLREQVAQCKSTLTELSRTAELTSVEQTQHQAVCEFTRQTVERWAVRRPGIIYTINCGQAGPVIEFDLTMVQALENILNNAADAGSSKVEVNVAWDRREVRISVRDWGSGIPAQLLEKLGKPIIHADRSGLGIGLMLSQATVERYGGRIEWRNVKEGGTIATLILPLTQSPPVAEVAQ
jgi:two-component system sensor histidine kinase RegB